MTESYISQLLTGKKAPPAPERTDIYDKIETFSRLPTGTLAMLADLQRTDALKRKLAEPPAPLFKEVCELILRKCEPTHKQPIRAMFEKEPFGALERLVTQKLLDVLLGTLSRTATDPTQPHTGDDMRDRLSQLGRSQQFVRV